MSYEIPLGERVKALEPSGIRKFFDILDERKDAISLGVGEPDFPTPLRIRQAGMRSLELGQTKYTSNSGLMALRVECAAYMERRFGLKYDPEKEILVTVGGSEAIDLTVRALVNPGDEVLVPQPSFVAYVPIIQMAGGVPVTVEMLEENEFRLTPEQLKEKITPRTKALVLPYPTNPTGGIMEREDLEQIAAVLRETGIFIISDEIYAEHTYGKKHVSIASLDGMRERCLIVGGVSKSHSMTGWRMGFAYGPQELLRQMTKIHQYGIMSAPTTSQHAALVGLRDCDDDVERMRDEFDKRRKLLLSGLRDLGLSCFEARGAFYLFPCIRSSGLSSDEFCTKLLEEESVAMVPGNAFGACGEGFVRCCYAASEENLQEALTRVERFLKKSRE